MRYASPLVRLATILVAAAALAACSNPTAPSQDCGGGVMAGSGNHC
jgi:hypothetical protein